MKAMERVILWQVNDTALKENPLSPDQTRLQEREEHRIRHL